MVRAYGVMLVVVTVVAALAVGCDGDGDPTPDAAIGFNYTATVSWDPTDAPEIQSMTVDGIAEPSGFVLVRAFASFDAAIVTEVSVTAITGSDAVPFTLVPSQCGGACGGPELPTCTQLTHEHESWLLHHGELVRVPDARPLAFDPDAGGCGPTSSGNEVSWAD